MKEIIRVERKRIFNSRNFFCFLVVLIGFSLFSSFNSLKKYNVYDSEGNVIISNVENLKESKKHETLLNEQALKDVVKRTDKSKYLYNSNLVTIVASNYNKKINELTDDDLANFYKQRIQNVSKNLGGAAAITDIEKVVSKSEKLEQPMRLGYAEGWKNLNNDLIDFITIIVLVVPSILLPLFGEDPKTKMRPLYLTTKYGKKSLVNAKVLVGLQICATIYLLAVGIFSIIKLSILGFEGANLPIQNSVQYFFCPYNITYLQQYGLNVVIGFLALLMIGGIALLFTVILGEILSGAVFVSFFIAIMISLPNNNFAFNHWFKNFLPYQMTDFNRYYIHPEIYNVFNQLIPTAIVVIFISIIVVIMLLFLTIRISHFKLERKLK